MSDPPLRNSSAQPPHGGIFDPFCTARKGDAATLASAALRCAMTQSALQPMAT